jgi:hypothetical protein
MSPCYQTSRWRAPQRSRRVGKCSIGGSGKVFMYLPLPNPIFVSMHLENLYPCRCFRATG